MHFTVVVWAILSVLCDYDNVFVLVYKLFQSSVQLHPRLYVRGQIVVVVASVCVPITVCEVVGVVCRVHNRATRAVTPL
jgi:hypothetical protein